jgi:hypothetical protein
VAGHQPAILMHDLDEFIQALDVEPVHRGAMPDLAFLELREYVGERAAFKVVHHDLKLRRSHW